MLSAGRSSHCRLDRVALIGWGIPEEDAKYYEAEVRRPVDLVSVEPGNRTDDPKAVFTRYGGYDRTSAPRR